VTELLANEWTRIVLKKLSIAPLAKKFSVNYGTRKFIAVFHKSPPLVPVLSQMIPTHILRSYSLLVACLSYISTLKLEAVYSFQTSVNFHQTTRRHIPEDITLYSMNLKLRDLIQAAIICCFTYLCIDWHAIEWQWTRFGLIIGLTGNLYDSWLHFTSHYHAQTSVLSDVAW
jgi:hypothetical protein